MKTAFTTLALALVVAVGLVSVARVGAADETTVTGNIMCAKCTLKKADAKECQDVLVSENDKGAKTEYYITKNDVAKQFGHVCQGQTPAKVTGAVSEKDGKTWITPSKMEKVDQKS
jgi:hypothetical protein